MSSNRLLLLLLPPPPRPRQHKFTPSLRMHSSGTVFLSIHGCRKSEGQVGPGGRQRRQTDGMREWRQVQDGESEDVLVRVRVSEGESERRAETAGLRKGWAATEPLASMCSTARPQIKTDTHTHRHAHASSHHHLTCTHARTH